MKAERCESCGTPIVRDPAQPRLCARCAAPPADVAGAIRTAVIALRARPRRTVPVEQLADGIQAEKARRAAS